MSIYNILVTEIACPHCGTVSEVEVDFRFGLRDLIYYRLGDKLIWTGKGVRTPSQRPTGGNYQGEGYTECPVCGRDYWVLIQVQSDVLTHASVDKDREDFGST